MEIILKYFDGFTPEQITRFTQLQALYEHWNAQINVISRKDIHALYVKHVLHSLSFTAVCTFEPGMRIVDIGTGGGFPGIPLAIFYPETEFVLVDSIGKKIKVVQEVSAALGLHNVRAIHSRVEDIAQSQFDFAVSRAVAPVKLLWQWAKPKIKKGKTAELPNGLLCLKGGDLAQEIQESGTRPLVWEVQDIFPEPEFADKYVLWVGR